MWFRREAVLFCNTANFSRNLNLTTSTAHFGFEARLSEALDGTFGAKAQFVKIVVLLLFCVIYAKRAYYL